MVRPSLIGAVLLAAACGGLDNRPLKTGAVTGALVQCDVEGIVGVVGDSTLSTTADGACRFRLAGLPEGEHELYVAPTGRRVELVRAIVHPTEVTDVGAISGRAGAFARVQVSTPGGLEVMGQVVAPELPLAISVIGRSGLARIGPFPAGCFRLEVTVVGYGQQTITSCLVEGEEKALNVAF